MLHIVYCIKDNSEATIEGNCLSCEYFFTPYYLMFDSGCLYLQERLQTGL
jgi:hypothetical protein